MDDLGFREAEEAAKMSRKAKINLRAEVWRSSGADWIYQTVVFVYIQRASTHLMHRLEFTELT